MRNFEPSHRHRQWLLAGAGRVRGEFSRFNAYESAAYYTGGPQAAIGPRSYGELYRRARRARTRALCVGDEFLGHAHQVGQRRRLHLLHHLCAVRLYCLLGEMCIRDSSKAYVPGFSPGARMKVAEAMFTRLTRWV